MEQRGLNGNQRAAERRRLAEPAGLGRSRRFAVTRHLAGSFSIVAQMMGILWLKKFLERICVHVALETAVTFLGRAVGGMHPRSVGYHLFPLQRS